MKKYGVLLSVIVAFSLIGCGGSDDDSTPTKTTTKTPTETVTTGKVIDDYLSGATVCADSNGNGKKDTTDGPCVVTNGQGDFSFDKKIDFALITTGGTDIGTGEPFEGVLAAPVGSSVVTPLTTVVQSLVVSGKTPAEANEIVTTSLGLESGTNLLTLNPVEDLERGSDEKKRVAQKILSQQSKIEVIIQVVSETVAAASDSITSEEVAFNTSKQISALMLNGIVVDSPGSIKEVIDKTVEETFSNLPKEEKEKAVNKVATIAQTVADKTAVTAKKVEELVNSVDVTTEDGLKAITESNKVLKVTKTEIVTTTVKVVKGEADIQTLEKLDVDSKVKEVVLKKRPTTTPPKTTTGQVSPTGAEGSGS